MKRHQWVKNERASAAKSLFPGPHQWFLQVNRLGANSATVAQILTICHQLGTILGSSWDHFGAIRDHRGGHWGCSGTTGDHRWPPGSHRGATGGPPGVHRGATGAPGMATGGQQGASSPNSYNMPVSLDRLIQPFP